MSVPKFKPAYNGLLVEPMEDETITKHGVIIPGGSTYELRKGKVLAIGDGTVLFDGSLRPCFHKPGDTILYGNNWIVPIEFERGGKEYHFLKDTDPYGVINRKGGKK
jgi:chaperonin GroES